MNSHGFVEIKGYFDHNSPVWRDHFKDCKSFQDVKGKLDSVTDDDAESLFNDALAYLSHAQTELDILNHTLRRLQEGENPDELDRWLENVGFPVAHNSLGKALVKRISGLYTNISAVINNFIRHIAAVLKMTLDEVGFTFSASPSISVKFK